MDIILLITIFFPPIALVTLAIVTRHIDSSTIDYSGVKQLTSFEIIKTANAWKDDTYIEESSAWSRKYRLAEGSLVVHSSKTSSKCALIDRCRN